MSRVKWIGAAVIVVLVVVLAAIVAAQHQEIAELRDDVDAAEQTAADEAAELDDLEAAVDELRGTVDDAASVTGLSNEVKRMRTQLRTICAGDSVSGYRANLDGQQLAVDYENYQYFSNLYTLLDAICGTTLPATD